MLQCSSYENLKNRCKNRFFCKKFKKVCVLQRRACTQTQNFKRNYLENYNDSEHAVKTKNAPFFMIFPNISFFHMVVTDRTGLLNLPKTTQIYFLWIRDKGSRRKCFQLFKGPKSYEKWYIRKDHEKWSIFCFYGMFWIVVVFEMIAFEILNLLQALRCNTQTVLNFLRKNRLLHRFFKIL